MKLKSLEAIGFKSFADRTFLEFNSGITAVVGPNGSGKSNISDALKWVMGEQSAKSLRGGNMQDVIFAGTQTRKPVGYAEVTMTLDNEDKTLNVPYDSVAITRRVYRSGESEYYINHGSCRLKDIHELLMDTGLGRDGYSMIGQGKIAEIVNAKPEDRRQMFEEASGITKYRYRKEEAERKLAHTNDNILRVNDIIGELEIQVEPLRIQAEKAKKFLNLREELKVLDINLSSHLIKKSKVELEEVTKNRDIIASDIEKAAIENTKIEDEINALFEQLKTEEESTEELRLQDESLTAKLNSHENSIAILKSKIEQNGVGVDRIKVEIKAEEDKILELESQLFARENEYLDIVDKEKELNEQLEKVTQELEQLNIISQSKNTEVDTLNSDIIEKMSEISELKSKNANLLAVGENFQERKQSIVAQLEDTKEKILSYSEGVETLEKSVVDKENLLIEIKEKVSIDSKIVEEKRREKADLDVKFAANTREQNTVKTRLKMLRDMERDFDGYSRSVKGIMTAVEHKKLANVDILGTVAQLITVPKELGVAIETSLGGSMQNIITSSENDAKTAISYLKNNKLGRATFLPITAAKPGFFSDKSVENMPGFIGIGAQLIGYDEKIKNVISGLLGRVVVVDTIDNAIKIAKSCGYKYRIVTLDGELLTPGGAMSGGSRNLSVSLFARSAEIEELAKKAEELGRDEENIGNLIGELSQKLATIASEIAVKENEINETQQQVIGEKSELSHKKEYLANISATNDALLAENEHLLAQRSKIAEDLAGNTENIQNLSSIIKEYEEKIAQIKDGNKDFVEQHQLVLEQQQQVRMKISELSKDYEMQKERVEIIKNREKEIRLGIENKNLNIQELNDTTEDLNDDIDFKKEQIDQFKDDVTDIKTRIINLNSSRKSAQDMLKVKQESLKEVTARHLALNSEQSKIEGRTSKLQGELEQLVNRLWDDYEVTIATMDDYISDIGNVSTATTRVNSLKEQIKNLGNINVDAIEEYKNIAERFEFLTMQRNDLVDAQKSLDEIIDDMTKIMQEQFSEKFAIISEHFSTTARELFGGGTAILSLTDKQNVLSSGVEIHFQPPGKSVKSMMSLSGGEQALVSIALLFAILKVRPAPFCVLDEIEAALDDVNVFRFADYLKKYCKDTQFVIVTHRRGTMEVADTLYGVTMQEKGITRVISLNIGDVGL